MARLWSSGFELNSNTANVEITSTFGTNSISSSIKRSGTYSLRTNPTSNWSYASYTFAASPGKAIIYVRAYLYIATAPTVSSDILTISSYINEAKSSIFLNTDRTLQISNFVGTLQTGTSPALSLNTWYRIELKIDDTTTNTIITAQLDGTQFATYTDAGTGIVDSGIAYFGTGIFAAASTHDLYFDDIAINDSSGSFQNSWPGEGEIIHLRPNAAGDNEAWNEGTTASPNTYQDIDEVTPDDVTTIITESTSTGELSDFNLDATPAALASDDVINCVQVGVRFNGTAAGTQAFALRIKASSGGAVEESGNIVANSTTYMTNANAAPRNYAFTLYDLPGASATVWTKSDLDTAQIGVNHTIDNGTNAVNISTLWLLVDHKPVAATTSTSSSTSTSTTSTSSSTSTSTTSTSSSTSTSTTSTSSSTTTTWPYIIAIDQIELAGQIDFK